jgi:hypothetical protein
VNGQDRLYNLLPALYRQVDEAQNQPLRALLSVLESELLRVEEDTGAMYDDWFIETCDLWAVPYIADLLGVREIRDVEHIPSQRRLVANSISYRRRKGTLAVLEKVVCDATGWYARSVEYADLVAATQEMERVQLKNAKIVQVRELSAGRSTGELPHTVDVDDSDQGVYNSDAIGLQIYRLHSYPVRRSFACPVEGRPDCFTFDRLGLDVPLFNQPQPVPHASQRAQAVNLPVPIRRSDLADDLREYLEIYGSLKKKDQPLDSSFYGPFRSINIELPESFPSVKPSSIVSMDLGEWPVERTLRGNLVVAVDVERGRLAFIPGGDPLQPLALRNCPGHVIVSYNYGFSSELGGGPYQRGIQLPSSMNPMFEIHVARGAQRPDFDALKAGSYPDCVPTVGDALTLFEVWAQKEKPETPCGVIYILDNGVYDEPVQIRLTRGMQLWILASPGVCPVIGMSGRAAEICLHPGGYPGASNDRTGCRLVLNGLHIQGGLQVRSQAGEGALDALALTIEHCSLFEHERGRLSPAALQCELADSKFKLDITSSILGSLYVPAGGVQVSGCIVDHAGAFAIAADSSGARPGARIDIENTTVFGRVHVEKLTASGVIFQDPVQAPAPEAPDQLQYSFVPLHSTTLEGGEHPCISKDIQPPEFTSTQFGHPAYGQLSLDSDPRIRRTAAGSEMGAFHDLYQVLAEENLRAVLNEYLPPGLRPCIQYIT